MKVNNHYGDYAGDALEDDFHLSPVHSEAESENESETELVEETQKRAKKANNKKEPKPPKKVKLDIKADVPNMTPLELEKHFNTCFKVNLKTLSDEEFENTQFKDTYFKLSDYKEPHIMENLAPFVKAMIKDATVLSDLPKAKFVGHPTVLMITSSAIRATDLIRALKTVSGTSKVAKLFSKHIKLSEQVQFLKENTFNIGVGTPNRILKLSETKDLKLGRLKYVILDMHRDVRKLNIADMRDTAPDLFTFYKDFLHPLLVKDQTKLILF
ncbi:hypothetical protein CONCODRAFT_13019 [Conidiobolus coronatus NRRL 28638]|uniref:Protein CMS1 n=1 Tax=Conidiobolus coronatus (strain ATCC 28846 / CBS 209.66 / NRRL 28638) TaxID=796925 RepID=A0A137NRS0_CONC2|nr:hypothetical protein CONCODRAFT_13019 [Conidiobolus coronatus NRRL 28638]|eukprot:KXN65390.1 hypothetical protein CONCODRAFT_13019 [Conidiobolus coronatus NRRL 28638]